jgi:GT2 family glycosyltransferase
MSRVTVVIPNWNGLAHLPECMAALDRQAFRDFSVVIVDNASSDESVAWLRENSPETHVIERADNGGFAVAVNAGIRAATGEFVALLNNDTVVDERWLAELVGAVDSSGYDAAASLMVLYDAPGTIDAAGDDFGIMNMAGRNRGRLHNVDGYRDTVRVLGACAGAALYRTSLFEDVGLFDEEFFLIHEDTDLNLRALIAGKRCLYVPSAIVRHKHSASIKAQPSWPMLRYETRNRGVVIAKDLPISLVALAVVTWPWRLFRSTVPLRPSKWNLVPGLARTLGRRSHAEFEGYRMGWKKRDDVWRRQAIPTREIIRWLFKGVGPV